MPEKEEWIGLDVDNPNGSICADQLHALGQPIRIGLLLDLDQGTLTVYKNDQPLGGF
jgi:hypothetical protein